jgi:hypothetical protein
MGWGDGQEFFRGWKLSDIPRGFSFVRALAVDGSPGVFRDPVWGPVKRVARVVALLRRDPIARREVGRQLRASYWWVRNARGCGSPKRVAAEERVVLNVVQLLELAGLSVGDIVAVCQCQSHRCVCLGCDCWDGQRLETWCSPAKPGSVAGG